MPIKKKSVKKAVKKVEKPKAIAKPKKVEVKLEKGQYSYKKVAKGYEVYDGLGKLHRTYSKEVSEKAVKGYVAKRN